MAGKALKMNRFCGAENASRWANSAQSNRLETDFSSAVRRIASPNRVAMETTRIFRALSIAAVDSIESVITSSFKREAVMRATAPPDKTPWVI